MAIRVFVSLGLVLNIVSVAYVIDGLATYYGQYLPSACYGNVDQGTMIGAASDSLWNNGAACGRMYHVKCTGPTNPGVLQPCRGEVTVKIVDRCPGCQSTIDLSKEAFAIIADPVAGIIKIDYSQVRRLIHTRRYDYLYTLMLWY